MGRWLAPVARRCPLSPNALTLLALLLMLLAAWLLAWGAGPARYPLAIVAAGVAGVLDVLDGVVAREKGLTSHWGDFLDHFSDRVGDVALTAGWVIGSVASKPIGIFAVAAVLLNGYAGTQIEATFRTREYRTTGRAEFFIAALGLPLIAWLTRDQMILIRGMWLLDFLTLLVAVFALVGVVQRVAHARRIARSLE